MADREEVDPEISSLVLPEGRTGLTPEEVAASQRRRLQLALAVVAARDGYGRATVDGIAATAKLSKATLYQLMGSREGLLASAVAEFDGRARAAIVAAEAAAGPSAGSQLTAACTALAEQVAREPKLARLAFVEGRLVLAGTEASGVAQNLMEELLASADDRAGGSNGAGAPVDAGEGRQAADDSPCWQRVTAGGMVHLIAAELMVDWRMLRTGRLDGIVDLARDLAHFAAAARHGPARAAEMLA